MLDKSITGLNGWFERPGAYVLVDGQFGSTGKGLLAGVLAEYGQDRITHVTTNAGPNSGHTAYYDNRMPISVAEIDLSKPVPDQQDLYEKIVTQQIPVASVFLERMGHKATTLLNAGAVIDDKILSKEYDEYMGRSRGVGERLLIHPCAAMINDADREADQAVTANIAGTGKGVGPAIARKIARNGQLAYDVYRPMLPRGTRTWDNFWDWSGDTVFVETAQGFSLGLNTARFNPYVTSRECTVMQAISDARIPAQQVRGVVACFRTLPIRVGNTPTGSSGECYEDQVETSWTKLGLEPELTTVTKRVRRVFTWSRIQFMECVAANQPDILFINFMNYLDKSAQDALLTSIHSDYRHVTGRWVPIILGGFGPHSHDVRRVA